jgi:dTDP-4-dehydrorhamnose reductase
MNKKVLIIGATGMIASRLVDLLKNKFEITGIDEKTLDITNNEAVNTYFNDNSFDTVINFAAFTNVDAAESQKGDESGLCFRLNVIGTENLIESCNKNNIHLIHISTDFVFTGTKENPGPYSEGDKPPEISDGFGWYGWTKNRAEHFIKADSSKYAIIRFGYPFRASSFDQKGDWARNLIKLYNEQKLYPLFDDQIQSIVFVDDLVIPMEKIIREELTGVYHLASTDTTTPYEIGSYLLEKYSKSKVNIQKGSMSEFLKTSGRTPRPVFGGLKTEKTQEKLGLKFKNCKEMVDEFLLQFND